MDSNTPVKSHFRFTTSRQLQALKVLKKWENRDLAGALSLRVAYAIELLYGHRELSESSLQNLEAQSEKLGLPAGTIEMLKISKQKLGSNFNGNEGLYFLNLFVRESGLPLAKRQVIQDKIDALAESAARMITGTLPVESIDDI